MSGLHEAFDEMVAGVAEYGDLDRAIEQVERERRRRFRVVAGLAAAAAVVAVIGGVLALTRDDAPGTPQPIGPSRTPSERTSEAAEWPGPVRTGVVLPVVPDRRLGPPANPWRGWTDPRDSEVGQVDIRVLAGWGLMLQEDARLEAWLSRGERVVEYGLVVDNDGDRVADCQLALNTDAPGRGLRAILRNLHTGETDERIGPPYGYPFEFGFIEPTPPRQARRPRPSLFIEFLGAWQAPCEPRAGRIHWYAYTSLARNGHVTAWDFAPDEAWLRTLPRLAVEFGGLMGGYGWGKGLPQPSTPGLGPGEKGRAP